MDNEPLLLNGHQLVFLSPDMLSPSENIFSKVKAVAERMLTNNTVKRSLIEIINEAIV